MPGDKDIAQRALDMQQRARDYRLVDIPSYLEWSKRQLSEGGNEALIAHLDATSMYLLPEDLDSISPETFDEMLAELRKELDES